MSADRAIAFFDFDGTLLTGDHAEIVVGPMLLRGRIPVLRALRFLAALLARKLGFGSRDAVNRAGFAIYAGAPRAVLDETWAALSASHLAARASPTVHARLEAHRARGDRLVLLTLAPTFVVTPLARAWGLQIVGTRLRFDGDVCAGEPEDVALDGPQKLAAAQAIAAEHGVPLAACTFYSDHPADLPLLEAVGTPVVVGDRADLGAIARARGWTVLPHTAAALAG